MGRLGSATRSHIYYFDAEGKSNLDDLLKVLRRLFKSREDLQSLKIVIFTAEGRGPALAYNQLSEFHPKMIAVTFPRGFAVKGKEGSRYHPQISENVLKFFKGVEIEVVVPPRLPFDVIEGMDATNQQMRLVRQTIAMFGTGFELCLQAVMCACDFGLVAQGESVIAFSGDTAGLFRASPTKDFLSPTRGVAVHEIFCKPRELTVSRPRAPKDDSDQKIIEGQVAKRLE